MIGFDGSKDDAMRRVTEYFDRLIAEHPDRAKKLRGAREYQLSQVDVEIQRYQTLGQDEAMAIQSGVDGARRSTEAKIR